MLDACLRNLSPCDGHRIPVRPFPCQSTWMTSILPSRPCRFLLETRFILLHETKCLPFVDHLMRSLPYILTSRCTWVSTNWLPSSQRPQTSSHMMTTPCPNIRLGPSALLPLIFWLLFLLYVAARPVDEAALSWPLAFGYPCFFACMNILFINFIILSLFFDYHFSPA